jgi:hypothetical protein
LGVRATLTSTCYLLVNALIHAAVNRRKIFSDQFYGKQSLYRMRGIALPREPAPHRDRLRLIARRIVERSSAGRCAPLNSKSDVIDTVTRPIGSALRRGDR